MCILSLEFAKKIIKSFKRVPGDCRGVLCTQLHYMCIPVPHPGL